MGIVLSAVGKSMTPGAAGAVAMLVIFVIAAGGLLTLGFRVQGRLRQQGFDPNAPSPLRSSDHTFDPQRSATFRGGCRLGQMNATAPLCRLTLDGEWAHLSGFVSVWVPRSAVTRVEAMRTATGIRFSSPTGEFDAVIFWSFDRAAVIAAFSSFGWPVDGLGSITWGPPPQVQGDRSGAA
jgi:hypothetical protein